MKISKYIEWSTDPVPNDAYYVIAVNGKNYKVKQSILTNTNNGGGTNITDYAYDILETADSFNKIFTLRYDYVPGSCKVYLRGLRQTLSRIEDEYDYEEIYNKQIKFTLAPRINSLIVVDYLALDYEYTSCYAIIDEDGAIVIDEDGAYIPDEPCI